MSSNFFFGPNFPNFRISMDPVSVSVEMGQSSTRYGNGKLEKGTRLRRSNTNLKIRPRCISHRITKPLSCAGIWSPIQPSPPPGHLSPARSEMDIGAGGQLPVRQTLASALRKERRSKSHFKSSSSSSSSATMPLIMGFLSCLAWLYVAGRLILASCFLILFNFVNLLSFFWYEIDLNLPSMLWMRIEISRFGTWIYPDFLLLLVFFFSETLELPRFDWSFCGISDCGRILRTGSFSQVFWRKIWTMYGSLSLSLSHTHRSQNIPYFSNIYLICFVCIHLLMKICFYYFDNDSGPQSFDNWG